MDEAYKRAWSVALRFLKYRPRFREEVRRRLMRERLAPEVVRTVLGDLEAQGWFDDVALSRQWIEERLRTRGLALPAIRRELRQKGVSEEVIEEAMASVVYDEEEVAFALLDKKAKIDRGDDFFIGVLVRRGYTYERAREYVRRWRTRREE